MAAELITRARPADGDPAGVLILHHGRGSDEEDLLPLADVLDPERRLHVALPRAPLQFPGSPGFHWYAVARVGYPDRLTFQASVAALAALHDEVWEQTGVGPERTVLGGFSQGTVMSYALGLSPGRPAPAGLMAFSGFIPTVEGWHPDLAGRAGMKVLIAHGRRDAVIDVGYARSAQQVFEAAGIAVDYGESAAGHGIDRHDLPRAQRWLATVIGP